MIRLYAAAVMVCAIWAACLAYDPAAKLAAYSLEQDR